VQLVPYRDLPPQTAALCERLRQEAGRLWTDGEDPVHPEPWAVCHVERLEAVRRADDGDLAPDQAVGLVREHQE